MRPMVLRGVSFGIAGGLVTCALQLVLTPANMILFSVPLALLIGVAVGLSARGSATRETAPRAAVVVGGIAGVGLFLGMVVGSIVYLALPSTQAYYRSSRGASGSGQVFNSYLAQEYVGPCSGISGLVDVVLVLGTTQVVLRRRVKA